MPKQFCPECGYKHEFMDKRPKFCTECGYGFTSVAKKVKEPEYEPEIEDELENVDDYNIPKLDASELNIGLRNTITLGQAVASPLPPSNFNRAGEGVKGLKRLQKDVAVRKGKDIGGK